MATGSNRDTDPTTGRFSPPGPGSWAVDRSHYPGGITPISAELMEYGLPLGMRRVFGELGIPADTLSVAFVEGFMYTRLRPLVGADRPAKRLPPSAVLRLVTRLHPAFRARNARAAEAQRQRPWLAVADRWDRELAPDLRRRNRAFSGVDLESLDDGALASHLDALVAYARETFELHFWLHGYDLGPIGFCLAEAAAHGLTAPDVVPALAGASPSTAEPRRVLARLRTLVEAAGVDPRTIDEVRAVGPEAAQLLDEYLQDRRDQLVTGYDLDALTLGELPDVVVQSITRARPADHIGRRGNGEVDSDRAHGEAAIAALLDRVPPTHRQQFEQALADARAVMDLRDANGPLTVEWPMGLLRLALLEVGRRLVARGAATAPEHAFELASAEVRPALCNGRGPGAGELEERAAARRRRSSVVPPPLLGPAEPAPPPDVLPAALRRGVESVQLVLAGLDMTAAGETGAGGVATGRPGDGGRSTGGTPTPTPTPAGARDGLLTGTGVGTQPYRGRVRRADTPEAAVGAMEPGDVLVVRATSPAFNAVLALAGAVVTADGGPLSHAAVLARELGIAAVVGARGALDLPDGAEVEVDPTAGEVRLL